MGKIVYTEKRLGKTERKDPSKDKATGGSYSHTYVCTMALDGKLSMGRVWEVMWWSN